MSDKTWTTYKMADGSSIYGEYAWVENEEFFEDLDEPTEVIKETWVLVNSETVTFTPYWWSEEDYEDEEDEPLVSMKLRDQE